MGRTMARKLRMEYPGALYHVYSQGNYRDYVFREEGARKAFLTCLEEACKRSRWVLHAYVLMGNHYHLALETPRGNLVEGMKWLQATFANRFNRFRSENGHVFQGRYQDGNRDTPIFWDTWLRWLRFSHLPFRCRRDGSILRFSPQSISIGR